MKIVKHFILARGKILEKEPLLLFVYTGWSLRKLAQEVAVNLQSVVSRQSWND